MNNMNKAPTISEILQIKIIATKRIFMPKRYQHIVLPIFSALVLNSNTSYCVMLYNTPPHHKMTILTHPLN